MSDAGDYAAKLWMVRFVDINDRECWMVRFVDINDRECWVNPANVARVQFCSSIRPDEYTLIGNVTVVSLNGGAQVILRGDVVAETLRRLAAGVSR